MDCATSLAESLNSLGYLCWNHGQLGFVRDVDVFPSTLTCDSGALKGTDRGEESRAPRRNNSFAEENGWKPANYDLPRGCSESERTHTAVQLRKSRDVTAGGVSKPRCRSQIHHNKSHTS